MEKLLVRFLMVISLPEATTSFMSSSLMLSTASLISAAFSMLELGSKTSPLIAFFPSAIAEAAAFMASTSETGSLRLFIVFTCSRFGPVRGIP